ncbi:hypothetical protein FGO68_gene1640 [Halteria grandinella]|uniref:Uncharacterized protein n=1 Tax=Halteria grandinella TaxID=5974 RepID=A0A8J8T7S9_HALGN|nr:hypothetical protein FGO68_gene1640 [Halteria grandinella]
MSVEEQKKSGYRYWVRERNDQLYDMRPTKVEDQKQIVQPEKQVASAWNKAGTWEDKGINREQIQRILEQFLITTQNDDSFIQTAKVLRGEGSLITVRGKRKLGYEVDLEIGLASGSVVTLIGICDDEDDCEEYKVSHKNQMELRKELVKKVKNAFEQFRQSL